MKRPKTSGWNEAKTEAFKKAFFDFTKHVKFHSKETGGDTVLFDCLYRAQHRFLDCIWDGLSRDIHVFNFLKSRQLGISTVSRALSIFWLGMHKGLQGAVVLDTRPHLDDARNEIRTMISGLPKNLGFPGIKLDGRDMLILDNGSNIRWLSAGAKKTESGGTLGRSSGINFAHESELCSYKNEKGMMAFEQSLSETYPDRLVIRESTADGFNYWYRKWVEAKNDNLNQMTCFIGWWAKETQVIERDTPSFQKYGLPPPTDEEMAKIDEVERRYGYRVTQEQLAWYRRKSNPLMGSEEENDSDNKLGAEDDQILQEQPWTEEESFLQSGSTFFPSEALTNALRDTASERYNGYQFFNSDEFINCDFELTTRKKDIELKVWEEPDQDGVYVIAADPAFGHSEENNNSAIQILRCYADCIEQVAEYANSSIQTEPFAWVIAALAGWYKNVYFILEINGPGEAVWVAYKSLKNLTLSGHLRTFSEEKGLRNIFNNVRDYMYARQDSLAGASNTYHWKTDGPKKVPLMERLRDFVSNKTLIIHSSEVLQEMKTVIRNGDSIGAEGRNRDDRTFSLAIGVRCWEERVRRTMSVQGRTKAHEIANKRMTITDQITMFNKNRLDMFFKQKAIQRRGQAALTRRREWRGR